MLRMKPVYEKILIVLAAMFVFLMVFAPHFEYPLPYHQDEWHHITEAKYLTEDTYQSKGYEIGFHAVLLTIGQAINLVKWYFLFPAIWAMVSSLVIFWVVKKLTNSFIPAIFSMILFASLRSNVNLLGIWFFVPLTFAIPFIYLYTYFLHTAYKNKNTKVLIYAIVIMLLLIVIHALSVLFIIPALIIVSALEYRFILDKWKVFSGLALIPLLGFAFYFTLNPGSITEVFSQMISELIFTRGWGVSEQNNSLLQVYSLAGYILAVVGLLYLVMKEKKDWVYILWPTTTLLSAGFFLLTNISPLVPFQRNLYYFALVMPILGSFGVLHLQTYLRQKFGGKSTILLLVILGVLTILLFVTYFNLPADGQLYKTVGGSDVEMMSYMLTLPEGTVLIHPVPATALFPISGQEPLSTMYFYGLKNKTYYTNFEEGDCTIKEQILQDLNVTYVYFETQINCGWELLQNIRARYLYKK